MSWSGWTQEKLLEEAAEAMKRAYVPYSKFRVGAALLDADGRVHYGCNVENAAYSPSNCAERTALFRAITDGAARGSFRMLAVVADTAEPVTPCGVCRQVLVELCAPTMPLWMGNMKGQWVRTTVAELLPGAFTSNTLQEE